MTMLLLQRRLANSDGWRTVARFAQDDAPTVQRAAELLTSVSPVWWRVVQDDARQEVLAIHDGRTWQAVADEAMAPDDPTTAPMPWWQPAAIVQRLRERDRAFRDTEPMPREG